MREPRRFARMTAAWRDARCSSLADALVFHALAAPSGEVVAEVAAWTHAALLRVLERHLPIR